MTPGEVERLDDETYQAFIRFMQREARAIEMEAQRMKRR